jgi:hypothetical protein
MCFRISFYFIFAKNLNANKMTTKDFMQALTPILKGRAEIFYSGGNYTITVNGHDWGVDFSCKVNWVTESDKIDTPSGCYYESWDVVTSVDVANLVVIDCDDVEPFTPEEIKELELLIAETIEEYA